MRSGEGLWGEARRIAAELDQNQQDYASQIGNALALQGSVPAKVHSALGCNITVDDWTAPEFMHLRRGVQGRCYLGTNALAGNAPWGTLQTVDGRLVRIYRMTIVNRNAASMELTAGFMAPATLPAAGGAFTTCFARDDRDQNTAAVQGIGRAAVVTPPVTAQSIYVVPALTTQAFDVEYVLTKAATTWAVVGSLVNQTIGVTLDWIERDMKDSEK